jgi:TRAP-type C4-dicarboxylate transport system permease small subunit
VELLKKVLIVAGLLIIIFAISIIYFGYLASKPVVDTLDPNETLNIDFNKPTVVLFHDISNISINIHNASLFKAGNNLIVQGDNGHVEIINNLSKPVVLKYNEIINNSSLGFEFFMSIILFIFGCIIVLMGVKKTS